MSFILFVGKVVFNVWFFFVVLVVVVLFDVDHFSPCDDLKPLALLGCGAATAPDCDDKATASVPEALCSMMQLWNVDHVRSARCATCPGICDMAPPHAQHPCFFGACCQTPMPGCQMWRLCDWWHAQQLCRQCVTMSSVSTEAHLQFITSGVVVVSSLHSPAIRIPFCAMSARCYEFHSCANNVTIAPAPALRARPL